MARSPALWQGVFSPPDGGKAAVHPAGTPAMTAASPAHHAARLLAPDRSASPCAAASAAPPAALLPAANPRTAMTSAPAPPDASSTHSGCCPAVPVRHSGMFPAPANASGHTSPHRAACHPARSSFPSPSASCGTPPSAASRTAVAIVISALPDAAGWSAPGYTAPVSVSAPPSPPDCRSFCTAP